MQDAEEATGAADQTLRRSLRVVVESAGEEAEASGMVGGSRTIGTETGIGKGKGVHRCRDESRHLRERHGVTESADGRHQGRVRVRRHRHVVGGKFCVVSI